MVKLLVTVPCKKAVLERFQQDFENELDIAFANEDPKRPSKKRKSSSANRNLNCCTQPKISNGCRSPGQAQTVTREISPKMRY